MNLYLLTFKFGKKIQAAWYYAANAGMAITKLEEELDIDVIKTVKVRRGYHVAVIATFDDLDTKIERLKI